MKQEQEGKIGFLKEPELQFRYEQSVVSPHDGLSMFGPYDADQPYAPKRISIAVVGHSFGVTRLKQFLRLLRRPLWQEDLSKRCLWPTYPGFEAAFDSSWPSRPTWEEVLDINELLADLALRDSHIRVGKAVDLYLGSIQKHSERDEKVDVVFCVVPEELYQACRPTSEVPDGVGPRIRQPEQLLRASGQLDIFGSYEPERYRFSRDFRRQLKARVMKYRIPIQIVRDSTLSVQDGNLRTGRDLTPLSDRAWNLTVAAYYKAGGKPWRMTSARDGVCYIGLAYKRPEMLGKSNSACCAAQMFIDTGDGIVFMGESGPWWSPKKKEYHLSRTAARELLKGVLERYRKYEGRALREIFLHSHSTIDHNEFAGFSEACPEGVKLVAIRVRQDHSRGLRLYREGTRPVVRGTYWKLDAKSCLLWTSGFKPRLATYDGWEIPTPLSIEIQHGKGDLEQVVRDIFGLTKLNYNACRLGDSYPVTVLFSQEVGGILVSNLAEAPGDPRFRFYI